MERECACGCKESFKVNQAHPGILYKKGHRPKPVKIPCGCGCGTMIDSVDKHGKPRNFVNGHFNRTRKEDVVRIFKEQRAIPENVAAIAKKLSKSWEKRSRGIVQLGCLQIKCTRCNYEWIYSGGKTKTKQVVCPKCRRCTSKIGAIAIDTTQFKICKCGCSRPIPPSKDDKNVEYLMGHGPKGDVPCKCGCGIIIHNPDSSGRFRDVILGHNANLRGPEFFSNIATKMRSGPTSPERRVIAVIKKYNLPIRYGGIGKKLHQWVGRFNPDFIATNAPLIIDVQGDYFHTIDANAKRDKRKQTEMLKRGYVVLYLWEGELKKLSDDEIAAKIKLALEEASDFSRRLTLIFG